MSDNDPSNDRDLVSRHAMDFVRTGMRTSANELESATLGAAALRGVGGLGLGLVSAVIAPIADKIGREIAGDD